MSLNPSFRTCAGRRIVCFLLAIGLSLNLLLYVIDLDPCWSCWTANLPALEQLQQKKMRFQVVFIVSWFFLWDFEFRTLAWVSSNHGPMLHVTRFWTSTAIERYTTLVCYERCSCTWGDNICAGPQRATINKIMYIKILYLSVTGNRKSSPKNGVRSSATKILSSSISCFP